MPFLASHLVSLSAASRSSFPGHQDTLAGLMTETIPPEVLVRPRLTLPSDIDLFPFSSFISPSFQVSPRPVCFLQAQHSPPLALPSRSLASPFLHFLETALKIPIQLKQCTMECYFSPEATPLYSCGTVLLLKSFH